MCLSVTKKLNHRIQGILSFLLFLDNFRIQEILSFLLFQDTFRIQGILLFLLFLDTIRIQGMLLFLLFLDTFRLYIHERLEDLKVGRFEGLKKWSVCLSVGHKSGYF